MNSPGLYDLANHPITTAAANVAMTEIEGLDGMLGVTIEARFQWGSGGATAFVIIQTTIDGTNWIDIARFDFTTATAVKIANLSGLLSKAIATVAALGSEGLNDGVLGNSLRAVITSTGTYANTNLGVRVAVR